MKKFALIIIVLLNFVFSSNAQEIELEKFLDKAYQATLEYRETFKNLVAEELRTYDYFRKDESLKDSRKIKSIFIVYQSPKNNSIAEYRNVIEFNGKNVARSDEGVIKFVEKLAKSDSSSEEFERLRKEANRFDGKSHAYGLTLGQGVPLQPFYRPFFEFQIVGKEKIEGREVVVVEYKQTKVTLRIKVNATDEELKQEPSGTSYDTFLPNNFRPTNPRVHGKLWLDAETGQIWRDEYNVTIQPTILSKPVVAFAFLFHYQSGEFRILTPNKFLIRFYRFSGKGEADLKVSKVSQNLIEYTKFIKLKTEAKEAKTEK